MLARAQGLTATLDAVCRLAVARLVPGQDAAVSLLARGAVHPAVATSDRARVAEELQARTGEGPAVDIVHGSSFVAAEDLSTDHRWEAFSREAVRRTGLRAVVSVRLEAGGPTIGALSLYSGTPGSLRVGPGEAETWSLFASHAAVALTGALAVDGLREALESRETISVAMGILMAREAITRQQALDVLRRASQRENLKLRDIAARIAGGDGHVLPSGPGS